MTILYYVRRRRGKSARAPLIGVDRDENRLFWELEFDRYSQSSL